MIQDNISLQAHNTLAIPAYAEHVAVIHTPAMLNDALVLAAESQWPVTVLGSGSNVVLPDCLRGLVLLMNIHGTRVEQETDNHLLLSVAAGENWHELVMHCVANQWYGIENLALIPGTVGAAPIQNIGAYGVELCDCFEYLEAVQIDTLKTHRFTRDECQFSYRDSVFKQNAKDQFIITRVVLRLSKVPHLRLDYPALQQALDEKKNSGIDDVADAVIRIRRSKLPDPAIIPNAGSFFKNPIVDRACYEQLQQRYPQLVAFAYYDNHYKLAAGWLIDQAGWKGQWLDDIAMHEQQALVLTNPNACHQRKILSFVTRLQQDIYDRYGIHLDIEPRIYSDR